LAIAIIAQREIIRDILRRGPSICAEGSQARANFLRLSMVFPDAESKGQPRRVWDRLSANETHMRDLQSGPQTSVILRRKSLYCANSAKPRVLLLL